MDAPERPVRSPQPDLAPAIAFELGDPLIDPWRRYRHSAQYIRDLFLAGDPETLDEALALAAIDLVEELRAVREILSRSLTLNHELSTHIDELTDEIMRLRDERARVRRTGIEEA